MKASRPHDETVVELLKAAPDFAAVYLAAALDEADQPGGQYALLGALRQIAEAQGMAGVAERAGIPREPVPRAVTAWQPDAENAAGAVERDGAPAGVDA